MKNVIKSLINRTDSSYVEILEDLVSTCKHITDKELEYFDFILKSFNDLDQTPTETVLIQTFPELEITLANAKTLSVDDLAYHVKSLINSRKAKMASLSIMDLASKIEKEGLSDNDIESLKEYIPDTVENINENAYDFSFFKKKYIEDKNKPTGLLTGVEQVDEIVGGLTIGTVNTIAAFTSQFKSCWGSNIAYNNTYNLGYNIAVLSLEVPREDYLYNMLGRHSCDSKFNKFPFIPHDKIRRRQLTEEEETYLLDEVLKDYNENAKGKLFILDETDFKNMSYSEIRETLYKVDDICFEKTGTGLDFIVVDHAHLLKFTDNATSKGKSEAGIVNDYISFFRRMTVKFRKTGELDEKGNHVYRQIGTLLLAQTNRQGFDNAVKKRGQYSLLAIAEFNEIERASYRIFTIWTDDILKEAKEAMVCILKNRSGRTQYEPMTVFADGEAYMFGDSDSAGDMTTLQISDSLDVDDFSDLLGGDLGIF